MPIAIGFAKPCIFMVHATGVVTYGECQRAMDETLAHPAFSAGCQILVEAKGVTGTPTRSELQRIAQDLRPMLTRGLQSMAVVTRPGFVYGVARMFAAIAEVVNLDVSVFTDMPSAEAWLAGRRGETAAPSGDAH